MYCKPWNAGLASETPAVCRRLGRLLTALDVEINSHIVEGSICDHIREFRFELMERLEAEGWTMSYDGGDRMKVRQPGHKRPFPRRVEVLWMVRVEGRQFGAIGVPTERTTIQVKAPDEATARERAIQEASGAMEHVRVISAKQEG